jgi:hypothetical protein
MLAKIAIGAVVGFAAGAVAFPHASAQTGPALIRITSVETHYARIDVGRPGRGIGDMELFTQQLFNRRITPDPIGHADTSCTFGFGNSRNCRTTYVLPRGKIVVGGSVRFREIYEVAILGGTGLYNNARGSLTATQTRRSPRREFLIFRLAG